MIKKLLASAVIAGGAAGLLAAVLHFSFVQELILLGERYESGALVHFMVDGAPHDQTDQGIAATGHAHSSEAGDHSHEPVTDTGTSPLVRNGLTVVFSVLVYVAYALILVAGFGLAKALDKQITAREGALWGLAGFAAFQLFPAMGLAPELPGTIAADLGARQVWWWSTVAMSITGMGLMAYGGNAASIVAGLVLLAVPHIIGAPSLGEYAGTAPPEIGAAFSARVLGVGLIVWAALGWIAGAVWAKESQGI